MSRFADGLSPFIVMTDRPKDQVVLLDGEKGELSETRHLENKRPSGVTTDNEGNIYVSCINVAY